MPHAENGTSQSLTNGHKQSSQTLGHIKSYPAVSDSIDAVKSNPYGAKAFETGNAVYDRFGQPIAGYLQGPYAYVKPYAEKADELGEMGLGKLDETFPIIKEDTQTLVDTARGYISYPFETAGKGRDYLFSTWSDKFNESAKRNNRGNGLLTYAFAGMSTILQIQGDMLVVVSDYLGPKKEAAKEKKDNLVDGAKKKKDAYGEEARSKKDSFAEEGKNKGDSYAKMAQNTVNDVGAKAQEMTS